MAIGSSLTATMHHGTTCWSVIRPGHWPDKSCEAIVAYEPFLALPVNTSKAVQEHQASLEAELRQPSPVRNDPLPRKAISRVYRCEEAAGVVISALQGYAT